MTENSYVVPVFHEIEGLHDASILVERIDQNYVLTCQLPKIVDPIYASDFDCYAALQVLRSQAEKKGWRICCLGSRKNVWPSAMARQMGGGKKAYSIELGTPTSRDSFISVFDPDTPENYCTVENQNAFVKEWFKSLSLLS